MKKIFYGIAMLSALTAASCKDAPKADEAQTSDAKTVAAMPAVSATNNVDLQKSNIQWIATKPTGRHHGVLMLKEGNVKIEGTTLQNGRFIVDLNSLTAYDDDNSANEKLQGHLKSADFFDVTKYGTAEFDITGVTAGAPAGKDLMMKDATHTVTGNLKIKEVTKSITFPAKITITADGKMVADAEFNIDRTLWGINYRSDKSLGDKIINNDVNIKVHLEATK